MPTLTVPASVAADLCKTLARLRMARTVGDESEARVSERRLNWILDKHIPRCQETL